MSNSGDCLIVLHCVFFTLDLTLETYRLAGHAESIYFIHIVVQQIIWTLGEKFVLI